MEKNCLLYQDNSRVHATVNIARTSVVVNGVRCYGDSVMLFQASSPPLRHNPIRMRSLSCGPRTFCFRKCLPWVHTCVRVQPKPASTHQGLLLQGVVLIQLLTSNGGFKALESKLIPFSGRKWPVINHEILRNFYKISWRLRDEFLIP